MVFFLLPRKRGVFSFSYLGYVLSFQTRDDGTSPLFFFYLKYLPLSISRGREKGRCDSPLSRRDYVTFYSGASVIKSGYLFLLKIHSYMVLRPGGGEKSSERKAAFSPPPGPPPLFWPRVIGKKMPAAFSTYFPLLIRDSKPMSQQLTGTMQVTGLTGIPLPLLLRAIALHFSSTQCRPTHSKHSTE